MRKYVVSVVYSYICSSAVIWNALTELQFFYCFSSAFELQLLKITHKLLLYCWNIPYWIAFSF